MKEKFKNGAKWLGNKAWNGVKKGANYIWEHKDEWSEKAIDSREKAEKEFYRKEDASLKKAERQSREERNSEAKELVRKKNEGETLSIEEKLYLKAVRNLNNN